MTLRTRVQTLIPAALLALAIAGGSAGPARAEPTGPGPNDVHCALPGSVVGEPEDVVFYLPGDIVEVKSANGRSRRIFCDADGQWIIVGLHAPTGARLPARLSGPVVARP